MTAVRAVSVEPIKWEQCENVPDGVTLECAEVEVRVDYDQPDGDTLTLSVYRAPATGDRIGALFTNPGGPGAPTKEFVGDLAQLLPDPLLARFDLVSVDPRGLGASEIDCGYDLKKLYAIDFSSDSPDEEQAAIDETKEYVDACNDKVGSRLAHLGSATWPATLTPCGQRWATSR